MHFFSPVVLGNGAEHLLRGAGSRRNVQQVRELVFEKVYPGRTAGGQNRHTYIRSSLQETVQSVE